MLWKLNARQVIAFRPLLSTWLSSTHISYSLWWRHFPERLVKFRYIHGTTEWTHTSDCDLLIQECEPQRQAEELPNYFIVNSLHLERVVFTLGSGRSWGDWMDTGFPLFRLFRVSRHCLAKLAFILERYEITKPSFFCFYPKRLQDTLPKPTTNACLFLPNN